MVITGHSGYTSNCGGDKCIPLPYNIENGKYWGSTSDVDDAIATVTGWTDFVFHYDSGNRPVNHPSDSSGWTTPKRALCGIEL
jgi:hypothetical protein